VSTDSHLVTDYRTIADNSVFIECHSLTERCTMSDTRGRVDSRGNLSFRIEARKQGQQGDCRLLDDDCCSRSGSRFRKLRCY
jgi:hypothetical protein